MNDELRGEAGVVSVHLNQQVRTITGGANPSLVRPDAAAKLDNGKFIPVEVMSPRQNREEQIEKLRGAFGDSAEDIICVACDIGF